MKPIKRIFQILGVGTLFLGAGALLLTMSSCQTIGKHPASVSPSGLKLHSQGMASWYGKRFHGRKTANGERYDMNKMTAAHPSLPFGTVVLVQSTSSGKTVEVRVNDRGPYAKGRIIDLSFKAAKALGFIRKGMDKVKIFILKKP